MSHIVDGKWHSDRHDTPPDIIGLDIADPRWHDLIWTYAERWRDEDAAFTEELQGYLRSKGFRPRAEGHASVPATEGSHPQ